MVIILPGTPRHMTDLQLVRGCARSGDYGLTQRQAAVVGGDAAMNQHGEAAALEASDDSGLQKAVLKTSAAQSDGVDAADCARIRSHAQRDFGHRIVKGPCDFRSRDTVFQIVEDGGEEVRDVNSLIAERERINAIGRRRVAGESFEFDGGLRFVGNFAAHAKQRGDGVEQSAATRSQRRVDVAREHRRENPSVRVADEGGYPMLKRGAEQREKKRGCDAGRVANRSVAARKRQVLEMRDTAEIAVIGDDRLAAPDCAVETIAGAVEGDTDHGMLTAVFGHAGGDVRMMMLNSDGAQAEAGGDFAPEGLRMKVVCGDARQDAAHRDPFVERIAEMILRRHALERTDVLAHQGLAVRKQTEIVLDVAADAENRKGRGDRHGERMRRTAAAEAKRLRATRSGDPHAVVAALMNRPVVQQQGVDAIGEYGARLIAV